MDTDTPQIITCSNASTRRVKYIFGPFEGHENVNNFVDKHTKNCTNWHEQYPLLDGALAEKSGWQLNVDDTYADI